MAVQVVVCFFVLVTVVPGYLGPRGPMISMHQPLPLPPFMGMQPMNGVPIQPIQPMQALPKVNPIGGKGPCPLTPYATFLTESQQQSLHELVTEAREQGADEASVKQHIYKYVSQVLPPQRFAEFQQANEEFEVQRRGKRSVTGKTAPVKVYDMLDSYTEGKGAFDNDYFRFYEEDSRKLRHD